MRILTTPTAPTVALTLGLAAAPAALAQDATFEALELAGSALDLTPDGTTVVGRANSGQAYYWSAEGGYTMIGGVDAVAVSDDGSTIFGTLDGGLGSEASIWTEADGWIELGGLPDALMCPSTSSAYEISADGTVGVGLSWDGCSGRGFRWTEATGMLELQVLGNGGNRASVVSDDGSVIGGFAQGSFSRTPTVWYADTTGMLLDPTGDVVGEVQGISDDGSILLGNWDGSAFTWTEDDGLTLLGGLVGGWTSVAVDIADDGTIVGYDTPGQGGEAWIRPPGGKITSLQDYLVANGAGAVPPLHFALAISRDATVIVGHTFFQSAWVATLPGASCPADIDGNGDVGVTDLTAAILAWGPCLCDEDVNGDGVVDVQDLTEIILAWGACD